MCCILFWGIEALSTLGDPDCRATSHYSLTVFVSQSFNRMTPLSDAVEVHASAIADRTRDFIPKMDDSRIAPVDFECRSR